MRRAFSLCILVAVVALIGAGCAKKKTWVDEDAKAGEKAPAEQAEGCGCAAPSEEEMPEACGEGCTEPCAEPCAEPCGGGAEEAVLDADGIPEGAAAGREEAKALVARFKALAEAKYKAGDVVDARELYKRALLLDSGDQEARDAYMRLSMELGERAPIADDTVARESDRMEARRQATIVALNQRLAEARAAEQDGDYEKAARKYEEILNILNWYKYQTDFPINSEQARGLIDRAREQARLSEQREREKMNAEVLEAEKARHERQREEELRQMNVFLRVASDAYDRGNYDLALTNAQKVLALDPHNEAAKDLVRIAQETKYIAERNEIREQFNDQWRTVMERLEMDAMPHPEVLNYPKSWAEISQRRPKVTGSANLSAPDPRADQILNTLQQKRVYDLSFTAGDITLAGAIDYLRSVTGLNFVMSQKVKEEKGETEIELKIDNVSVAQVLQLITEPNEMAWKIRSGVVMILSKEEAIDKPILQFYDVKDLVAKISDFPGQEINLVPSKYQPPDTGDADVDPVSPFEVDQLQEVIKQTIDQESWDTVEGAEIQVKNNVLVITQTPETHQRIAQFLSDLRKNTGLLVSLEVRFLTAEDRFLREVGVDIRGLGDQTGGVGLPGLGTGTNFDDSFSGSTANPSGSASGTIPEPSSIGTAKTPGAFFSDGADGEYKGRVENLFDFILGFDERGQATASAASGGVRGANSGGFTLQHTFLDDTQIEVILRAVEKSERIEEISAPRLTVYDTQRANVSVMKQNSYVQDFDVEIAQSAAIGDPIIQTIRDGIILDVRPIVSADRRFITMEMRPTVADLVRPIPTFLTSLATGPPVTIQVPEIAISRVRTTVTMPDGGTLLLGGIKFFRDLVAEAGLPVLNKVPILSFLFGRKAKTVQRRNLLILVKAEVVVPEEHAPNFGAR